MVTTGKDIHEMYAMSHLDAKPWDEVSPLAKRLYAAMARELNEERDIVAVKCPTCDDMMSAYGDSRCECHEPF